MSKEIKITTLEKDLLDKEDFEYPAKYYIVDAMGYAHFIHCRKIEDAIQWITENYGTGKYRPITAKQSAGKGGYSATGTNTRKGFSPALKKTI